MPRSPSLALMLSSCLEPSLARCGAFSANTSSFPSVFWHDLPHSCGISQDGMERKDLLEKNCGIFKEQGELLNTVASKNVKVCLAEKKFFTLRYSAFSVCILVCAVFMSSFYVYDAFTSGHVIHITDFACCMFPGLGCRQPCQHKLLDRR